MENVEPGSPQMTIWRMRIACWKPKATNSHSQYVIVIAFPLQQWVSERVMLGYTLRTLPVFLFLWTDQVLLRPPIKCCMAAELHQQVCRADFQGNVLSLFVIHVQ